jgi:hypothetical protein
MNKKLSISIPVLIVIIISVVITTIMMNHKEPGRDPNLSPTANQSIDNEESTMNEIYVTIKNQKHEIDLENNSTVSELVKMLPLELTMTDLNSNEKYAYLAKSLPTNIYSPEHIEAGDVMLFGDNCLVIFYKSFTTDYDYSKIGHINNLPELDSNTITVNLSTD